MRKTGQAPLPEPMLLSEDTLLASRFDSTRVRVRAQLVKLSADVAALESEVIPALASKLAAVDQLIP